MKAHSQEATILALAPLDNAGQALPAQANRKLGQRQGFHRHQLQTDVHSAFGAGSQTRPKRLLTASGAEVQTTIR